MYKIDQERAAIVEGHFYPWRATFGVGIFFVIISFLPFIPDRYSWVQILSTVFAFGAFFLSGARWMYDRTVVWEATDDAVTEIQKLGDEILEKDRRGRDRIHDVIANKTNAEKDHGSRNRIEEVLDNKTNAEKEMEDDPIGPH